jgi:hypothetical protein
MPVSGRELASLDFANLIGGPLNAVVEAQAKSAITTANFIREVGFDKEGKVVDVDFTYNRKNDNGSDQEFTLTLPFLSMLPVPYITVQNAVIEFNAKITSTTETSSESNFSQQVDASAGGRFWFISAKVTSKTSYQRKSAHTDKEERTFDMHVRVEAQNQDMPAGTERILTLLENSITERTEHKLLTVGAHVLKRIDDNTLGIESGDAGAIEKGFGFSFLGKAYTVDSVTAATEAQPAVLDKDGNVKTAAVEAAPAKLTLKEVVPQSIEGKTIDLSKPK